MKPFDFLPLLTSILLKDQNPIYSVQLMLSRKEMCCVCVWRERESDERERGQGLNVYPVPIFAWYRATL